MNRRNVTKFDRQWNKKEGNRKPEKKRVLLFNTLTTTLVIILNSRILQNLKYSRRSVSIEQNREQIIWQNMHRKFMKRN